MLTIASLEFLVFFALVLTLNWLFKKWSLLWRLFLLFTSWFLYYLWDAKFLLILAALSLFNFIFGKIIERDFFQIRRFVLACGILANLVVLGFFKYYDFFRVGLEGLLQRFGFSTSLPFLEIILPIGISFYIFRVISYLVDVYRNIIPAEASWLDFFIYVSFFPHLLAGPISRAGDFLVQLKRGGAKRIENLYYYFTLILSGLLKKLVLATFLSETITSDVFAVPENHSALAVLLAIFAYTLIIYFDFSGYSDLAIGFSGLLGFSSPLNFSFPYLAQNIKEFWRRWHISFSFWIRDYIYIPLGGSKVGKLRKYFNLMASMLLAGFWHGASWHFIFWGFWHGLGLTITHFFQDIKEGLFESRKFFPGLKRFFGWFFTFIFISVGWVFFKAETLKSALKIFKALVNFNFLVEPLPLFFILGILVGFLFLFVEKSITQFLSGLQEKLPYVCWLVLAVLLFLLLFKLGPDTLPPFIYFRF